MQAPAQAGLMTTLLKWVVALAIGLGVLWVVFSIYAAGQPIWALGVLALFGLGFYVYLSTANHAYRYLYPGVAAMLVFVAFPLFYTASIGFTNYSSAHLLSEQRARAYLLDQSWPVESTVMDMTVHAQGNAVRLLLRARTSEQLFATPILAQEATGVVALEPAPALDTLGAPLEMRQVIQKRDQLMRLQLKQADGVILSYAGLREFAVVNPLWKAGPDGALVSAETGTRYLPNRQTGFFESDTGERLSPGFTVGVGLDNYARMINDPDFRGPFLSIFVWTVAFSALTVAFTVAVGLPLAVLLNWEALRFRTVYRTLVFLPYAVPAFISILVFKGLFNQNFGEINTILHSLFGVRPAWFADPMLAKIMILIVNTWLGYPYIMILCSGLMKAIPSDLYEASALAGAGPLTNFFKITAPLIIKPLTPLLITVFAFNFNNFVVIALLTDGRPDFLNTKVPAGQTDILVSYTYRLAFQDTGQNFGLAAAVSTVIFFMIALMSIANLRLAKVNAQTK
ncbi:maltose transporter [beta proteobacterium AAP99]|nr:maltose transporter [beta proteobacterium AAP99]